MKPNAYFDNAATTWPKPEPVYTYMDSFFRSHGVNPGRSGYLLSVEAEQMIHLTRTLLARFFGFSGDPQRVVFTLNATDSLNTALSGLLQKGDHVVSTRIEHNAVLRTLNHMQRDLGIEVTLVPSDSAGYVDPDLIKASLKTKTRAVVINHASNVLGSIQPLESIAERVRDHPAKLIVDTAQTAGVIPISMSASGIDILTFTGHKGLFGPSGIGGMVVAEDVILQPVRFGGTGVDSASDFQPEAYPHRLEAGTLPLAGIAGLFAAQNWFSELGRAVRTMSGESGEQIHQQDCLAAVKHIHTLEMQYARKICDHLSKLNNVEVLGSFSTGERVATISFTVQNIPAQQVADLFDADHQVCVRAGLHCAPLVHADLDSQASGGAVRISPGYFTDEDDLNQLIGALDHMSQIS